MIMMTIIQSTYTHIKRGTAMTTLFYAENRETGKRWYPERRPNQYQHIIMYTDGTLAVLTETEYEIYTSDLDPLIWKTVFTKPSE